ncbi:MAG TPA: hypothetical protein VKJ47_05170 [Candidatus Binatia bacterium]|nr:hypothetical protein [Candidatus Binatia bacterium]
MPDKLIPLCRLYENVSRSTGKRYFVGNLSFTAKLLLLRNEEAKDGEPQWTLFLAEREPKSQAAPGPDGIPDPGEPARRRGVRGTPLRGNRLPHREHILRGTP